MTWMLVFGEILLFLYLVVEVICVFTYRRRLRKIITLDVSTDHFSGELELLTDKRQAFFEGYKYAINVLPNDFFKPKHRLKLIQMLDTLIDSDPTGDIPPEQEQRDDRG